MSTTLCELEAAGVVGWADVVVGVMVPFFLGCMLAWWIRGRIERDVLLALLDGLDARRAGRGSALLDGLDEYRGQR